MPHVVQCPGPRPPSDVALGAENTFLRIFEALGALGALGLFLGIHDKGAHTGSFFVCAFVGPDRSRATRLNRHKDRMGTEGMVSKVSP